jgi:hypothetical protein
MRTRRLATTLAILGCSLAAAPAALAGGPGHWTRISSTDQSNIDQPGYSRTDDDVLHVIVKESAGGPEQNLSHVAISANGTVIGSNHVEVDWAGISDPALVTEADGHSLDAFWGGIRTTDPSETNKLLNWSASGDRGASWTLVPGTVAQENTVYTQPMGAARLGDVLWQAWGGAFAHRGTDPAVAVVDLQGRIGGGCCGYNGNVATDEATGEVVATWYSNATGALGIWTQKLDPATGAAVGEPVRMPGSVETFLGSQETANLDDRTPIASLGARGFFVAYPSGYPGQDNVRVWHVGDAKSTKLAAGRLSDVAGTTISATPDGRLWVALTASVGGKTRVLGIRSNVGATKWGSFVIAKPPKNTTSFWSVYGEGSPSGALDLLAVVTTGQSSLATWHSQLEPGLTLTGPAKLPRKKSDQVFRVLDAGDPVQGAKVKVAGITGTTNSVGRVQLSVGPFGKKKKSAKASAAKDGYAITLRSFHIKKH